MPAALALVAAAAAAHAAPRSAAPGTAVIERIDLDTSETSARLEIALDRELAWSVGRDRDGSLALDLPHARPGHGVVSRVLPGGLVAELRIASVGIPSRPVTRLAIVTRGAADHRVAVDGRRLVVELVPTGSPFPDAATAAPSPEVLAPPPAIDTPAPAPLPEIESEDLEAPELMPPPAGASETAHDQTPAIPASEAPRELTPGAVASLPAPAPPVALAPAPAGAAPPLRVLPPLESAPVPGLAADPGVPAPQPLAPAPASPPVRILPPPLAPASIDVLDAGAGQELAPDPSSPGASVPLRIEVVEPPPPPLNASPVDALSAPLALPAELPTVSPELRILPPPLREVATRLTAVARLAPDVLAIAGNGAFEFTGLRLENPERFVIDLHGVVNQTGLGALDIDEGVVARVRVSQFRSSPVPVTRIIFDLVAPAVPAIEPAADGLLVRFPAVAPRSTAAPPR